MTLSPHRLAARAILRLLSYIGPAEPLRSRLIERQRKAQIEQWVARGRPAPPPHGHKQEVLRQYAAAHQLRILVETGTQHGQMLAALSQEFARLYSIELDPVLCKKARRRFRSDRQIELFCGDSAALLPAILARLQEPALFWLDGHSHPNQAPSGGQVSPVLTELAHLFAAPRLGHVIIIDDVRLFHERFGYPSLPTVRSMIDADGGWDVLVQDDSLRLTPCPERTLAPTVGQGEPAHG